MSVEYVSVREFDNFTAANAEQLQSIWHAIERQAEANVQTSENVAVITTQIKEDREDRKVKDQRVWALTLTFIGVMFTASIPFLVKAANLVLGVVVG